MTNFVVGGGVAGIVASILLKLKDKSRHVCLIESSEECGGLLKSKVIDQYVFDYGSHVVSKTGVEGLDSVLLNGIDEGWVEHALLRSGSYFNGILNSHSNLISITNLSKHEYEKILLEFIECLNIKDDEKSNSLVDFCQTRFGHCLSNNYLYPLINKLQGEVEGIHKFALQVFGLSRVILGKSNMMNILKQSKKLDEYLGYASNEDGVRSLETYYPKQGGVGEWIDLLMNQAIDLGVEIRLGVNISRLKHEGDKVKEIEFNGEEVQNVESLYWTVPIPFFAKLIDKDYKFNYRPRFTKMKLYHFSFDHNLNGDNQFIYCNDPSMDTYRVTVYSNLRNQDDNRCTVEVINGEGSTTESIQSELEEMGVINKECKIEYSYCEDVNNGFPVFSEAFFKESNRVISEFSDRFVNCEFMGKAATNKFFMNDVLIDVYEKIYV